MRLDHLLSKEQREWEHSHKLGQNESKELGALFNFEGPGAGTAKAVPAVS